MMGQNLGGHGRNEGVLERLQRETLELAAMVKENGKLLDTLTDKSRRACAEVVRLRKQNEMLIQTVNSAHKLVMSSDENARGAAVLILDKAIMDMNGGAT